MVSGMKIQVSAGAILLCAALLLFLPLQWIGAALLAVLIHESCHAIAVYLLGGSIRRIFIGCRGMVMETLPMSGVRELICVIAGPVGSIMLIAVAPRLPRTAICGFIHGIYNLIPLFPLDGGRVIRNVFYSFLSPPLAHKVFLWSQRVVSVFILVATAILTLRLGVVPLVLGLLVARNYLWQNPLAKIPVWRYNKGTMDKEVRP